MNEVIMLREAEPVKIIHKVLDKRAPVMMSYLCEDKWCTARLVVIEVSADMFKARVSPRMKVRPINMKSGLQVGMSFRYEYGYGQFIFDTTVLSTECSVNGEEIFGFSIPEQVEMVQRRSYFRVKVPGSENIDVTLWHRNNSEQALELQEQYRRWKGKLVDLSAGGLQVAIDTKYQSQFQQGQFLGLRFVPIANETPVAFNAKIRNILPTANDKNICIGLQMVGLEASPEGRFVLQRLCNVVQQYQNMNQTGRVSEFYQDN